MLEVLGMTFSDFISNRKLEKLETGTLLDNILKDGIPEGKITMMVGESNVSLIRIFNKFKKIIFVN
jgi:hypothetical protein